MLEIKKISAREKKNFFQNKKKFEKKIENYFLKKLFFIFHFSFFIAFVSCSKGKIIFEKNYDISQHQWLYKDSLSFSFDVPDTTSQYDIQLVVKHDNTYPFQNLYLGIRNQVLGSGNEQQNNSLKSKPQTSYLITNFDLVDNTGKPLGKSLGSSTVFTSHTPTAFNVVGKYTITLSQFTRIDSLAGIENVGLAVIKKDSN